MSAMILIDGSIEPERVFMQMQDCRAQRPQERLDLRGFEPTYLQLSQELQDVMTLFRQLGQKRLGGQAHIRHSRLLFDGSPPLPQLRRLCPIDS